MRGSRQMRKTRRHMGLLYALALAASLTGCDSTGGKEGTDIAGADGINGYIYLGSAYQNEGITTGTEQIFWSDWDSPGMRIICQDPTCGHLVYNSKTNPDPVCSAAVRNPGVFTNSIVYNGRRLIFVTSSETKSDVDEMEIGVSSITTFYTDIYECEMDGSNRRRVGSFEGSVDLSDGLIYDHVLYFSSFKKSESVKTEEYTDEYGIEGYITENADTHQLCTLDLSTMEFTGFSEREGSNFTDITKLGNHVYSMNDGGSETSVLYRLDTEDNTCEEVYKSDAPFWLAGGIDQTLLFFTQDMEEDCFYFYLYDENTGETKDLVKSPVSDACVVGDCFAVKTEYIRSGEEEDGRDYKVEYSFYNKDGELLQKAYYQRNVTLMFTVGDHLLFNLMGTDEGVGEKKDGVYVADKDELLELEEKGTYIFRGF